MQNIMPSSGGVYVPTAPYENTFWTLSLEIHFYLLYPLVLLVIRKFGAANMLVLSLAVGIFWNLLNIVPYEGELPYFFLHLTMFAPFWFTWCIGAYVAEIEAEGGKIRRLPLIAGIAAGLVVALVCFFKLVTLPLTVTPLYFMEYPEAVVIAAVLLWSLKSGRHRFWKTSPVRIMAFVGVFSYSLYAIHYTCLRVIRTIIGPHHPTVFPALLACVVIVPVAFVFFMLIEQWTLRSPRGWFKNRATISRESKTENAVALKSD
jgi:peptidoglycan/LPS O-acetylase OafA/YrhL